MPYIFTLGWPKRSFGFSRNVAVVVLSFIRNDFVRLHCDSCHMRVHLKNNLLKLVNFCVAILTLKIEENMLHFWHIMLYYFKKGKNANETQKEICAVVLLLIELVKSGL